MQALPPAPRAPSGPGSRGSCPFPGLAPRSPKLNCLERRSLGIFVQRPPGERERSGHGGGFGSVLTPSFYRSLLLLLFPGFPSKSYSQPPPGGDSSRLEPAPARSASACSRVRPAAADSHPMARQDLGLGSDVPLVPRPGLNRRRRPQPARRISLTLPEPSHMVVKFLLGRCFHLPAGHLVCGVGGNSLQAKSVNLKKKNSFLRSSKPPAILASFPIVLCFLSCLLIF